MLTKQQFELIQIFFCRNLDVMVEEDDILYYEEDDDNCGYYSNTDNKVHIYKYMDDVLTVTTVVHELMHLIQYKFKKSLLFDSIDDTVLYELVPYNMRLVEYEARYMELSFLCFLNKSNIRNTLAIFDDMDKDNNNFDLFISKINNKEIENILLSRI